MLFETGDVPNNPSGIALSSVNQPSATVMFTDSKSVVRVAPAGNTYYTGSVWFPQYRHLDTTVVGFFDGHVKSMRKDALEVKSDTEGTNTGLTGDAQFTLWNLY